MAKKRNSKVDLVASMKASAKSSKRAASPSNGNGTTNSRQGKFNITGYFPGDVKTQLKVLGANEGKTVQQLLAEALNDLFVKNGLPELAATE